MWTVQESSRSAVAQGGGAGENPSAGKTNVQKNRTFDPHENRPDADTGAKVITFAIACCGLALAVVVAVAYSGV